MGYNNGFPEDCGNSSALVMKLQVLHQATDIKY